MAQCPASHCCLAEGLVHLGPLGDAKADGPPIEWAMTMVKLPGLELKEVERIVDALEHYGAQNVNAPEYLQLAEMLRRKARIKGPSSSMLCSAGATAA